MSRISSTLLPLLLVVLLALYVNDAEAKTCKAKSHNKHIQHKQQHQTSKAAHPKEADHKAAPAPKKQEPKKQPKPSAPVHKSKKVSTTPRKGKAGVAGGQSLKWTGKDLAWFYDWSPTPKAQGDNDVQAATMLWGLGKSHGTSQDNDVNRFNAFKKITPGSYDYVLGPNEPDFEGGGSSGYIDPKEVAAAWDSLIAPHGEAGSILISPSMAKQKDETWMKPFLKAVKHQPDAIAVHIFQNDISKVKPVLDHFAQYGKPMWVTEFACINYQNGANAPCGQAATDEYISKAVDLFEADDRVAAYSVSDAYNGPFSALTPDHNGQQLSQTGQTFKQAVAKFAQGRRSLDTVDSSAKMLRRSLAHRRHASATRSE